MQALRTTSGLNVVLSAQAAPLSPPPAPTTATVILGHSLLTHTLLRAGTGCGLTGEA